MKKKQSLRDALLEMSERASRAETREHLLSLLVVETKLNQKPLARQTFKYQGGKYTLELWQPQSAYGGFVAEYTYIENQRPMVRVFYLDNSGYQNLNAPMEFRTAIEDLISARNKALQQGAKA